MHLGCALAKKEPCAGGTWLLAGGQPWTGRDERPTPRGGSGGSSLKVNAFGRDPGLRVPEGILVAGDPMKGGTDHCFMRGGDDRDCAVSGCDRALHGGDPWLAFGVAPVVGNIERSGLIDLCTHIARSGAAIL